MPLLATAASWAAVVDVVITDFRATAVTQVVVADQATSTEPPVDAVSVVTASSSFNTGRCKEIDGY
jgi:hypothetical protein